MNILYFQLSQEILMLFAQDNGRMMLLNQSRNRLSHYQLDINKWLIKPTQVINNSMSCIDLLFCTNQNSVSNYVGKFRDNIICSKINGRVPLPPLYVREVWDYSQANVENIKKVISNFKWSKALEGFVYMVLVNLLG